MGKFLHHEPVAAGVFNLGYSSGVGALLAWDPCLQNTPELLDLVCTRLERDWNSLAPKMRRAWGLKECDTCLCIRFPCVADRFDCSAVEPVEENIQKICGAYLACVRHFQTLVSTSFAESAFKEIQEMFLEIIIMMS